MKKISAMAQEMIDVYRSWPEHAEESFNSSEKVDVKFNDILVSGMGGSGIIANILYGLTDHQIFVAKGYFLPKKIAKDTLVICNSASGNTIETLTLLKTAHKTGCKIIAFSSGGKIEKYCKDNKIPFNKYKMLNSPRTSLVFSLYTILGSLSESLGLPKTQITESISNLKKTRDLIFSADKENNPSVKLAKFMSKIPICYYSPLLLPAALRFKNDLQENCKKHAMIEEIAESCHNSINAWERPSNISPILFRKQDDHILIKKQFDVVKEYLESKKVPYFETFAPKGNLLNALINTMYHMGYATILRAISDGIDPTDIPAIRFIKARL
ncbi:MAG: glucose-6-phosphate isomerase [Nitrosopumilus sp.]|nr:glucose-6-phosphate isomerase [Nitrosopumilus sp.]